MKNKKILVTGGAGFFRLSYNPDGDYLGENDIIRINDKYNRIQKGQN